MKKIAMIIFSVLFACGTAHAAITSGTAEIDYPNLGTVFEGPVAFTAPQTLFLELGYLRNDITATDIYLSFPKGSAGFATSAFNGEVFNLPNDTITGLAVNQNMGANVTFDPHHIYVNFSGLNFTVNQTFVDIGVEGPVPSVPEPFSLLLLGIGLAGLAVIGRRNERRII